MRLKSEYTQQDLQDVFGDTDTKGLVVSGSVIVHREENDEFQAPFIKSVIELNVKTRAFIVTHVLVDGNDKTKFFILDHATKELLNIRAKRLKNKTHLLPIHGDRRFMAQDVNAENDRVTGTLVKDPETVIEKSRRFDVQLSANGKFKVSIDSCGGNVTFQLNETRPSTLEV